MKKLSILFLAMGLFMSSQAAYVNCDGKCKDKAKCAECKKEEKAEHKCNAQCHKNGAGHVPSHGEKGHKCTDACKKK
jgi:hypothetical protein